MKVIYLLRRLINRYPIDQRDLYMIFIDLEKAYDRVPMEVLWKVLEKKQFQVAYIRVVKYTYDRITTSFRTQGKITGDFHIL